MGQIPGSIERISSYICFRYFFSVGLVVLYLLKLLSVHDVILQNISEHFFAITAVGFFLLHYEL